MQIQLVSSRIDERDAVTERHTLFRIGVDRVWLKGGTKRLDGLEYTMAAQGLAPDARLAQWVLQVATAAAISSR